ncbi:MAG: class I SAM-dependent methyltransferase [Novosphingobium sp.]|nr:class I SAM-dependent methyltransferase [Novosphingobium sp.]
MTSGADWQGQVGRSWAALYPQTDRSLSGLTARLLERIATLAGEAILDIGCGAGELTLAVARTRPRARIVGVDVSPELIEVAQARADRHGNVEFVVADAASWPGDGVEPELLISRHGMMFFDDPLRAFAHLRAIAAPGANLVFSCFRAVRENRWAADIAELLKLPPPPAHAPGPFAFADPQRVEALLAEAGWSEIDCEPVDFAFVAGAGPDPLDDAVSFFHRIGPAATVLAALEEPRRGQAEAALRRWVEANCDGDLVAFAAAAWIVSARN